MLTKFSCLLCSRCHKSLVPQILFKDSFVNSYSGTLICSCQSYLLLFGILYTKTTRKTAQAVQLVNQGKTSEAIRLLTNIQISWWILFKLILFNQFLQKSTLALFQKHFHQAVGFSNFIKLLRLFGYPNSWSWYLLARKQTPSYFLGLLATNLLKNKTATLLDLGCGTGHILGKLSQNYLPENVVGLDESLLHLVLARFFWVNPNSLLICADMEIPLPFKQSYFDAVISVDSFHYVTQKKILLHELNRITSTNGFLALIQILNQSSGNEKNIKSISPLQLKKLLNVAGFKKSSIYSNSTLWNNLQNNEGVRLNQSDSPTSLKKNSSYSVFSAKKKLPLTIQLASNNKEQMHISPIDYRQDQELRSGLFLENLIHDYETFIFISPHLDDAVLSCEQLIRILKQHKKRVIVLTVFTQASSTPFTPQALEFMKICGYKDPKELFVDRKNEDIEALKYLNCEFIHLNFTDAAWRKTRTYSSHPEFRKYLEQIPRLTHVYSSNRSQFSGKISWQDKPLILEISRAIESLINKEKFPSLLLSPLGIGGHADHVIVLEAVKRINRESIYWEDYPYSTSKSSNNNLFIKGKQSELMFLPRSEFKKSAISFYTTYSSQEKIWFSNKKRQLHTEKYYNLSRN